MKNSIDEKLRILFSRTSIPETSTSLHGFYYEKALKKNHELITYGPALPEFMYKRMGFERIGKTVDADIPYFSMDLPDVLRLLPWKPDLFLWTDNIYWFLMNGLREFPCPTACFFLDPQYLRDLKIEMAKHFDYVFVSQKKEVERYRREGVRNVYWLTHACDRETHSKKADNKLYDITFVGTMNAKRESLLSRLRRNFKVHYERCHGVRMAEVYSQSKIIFNTSTVNEINMRVFEAMASGSMLLTDKAPGSGLEELFTDRIHLVYYSTESDLISLADYYLKHDDERECIAKTGMTEVLEKHTYDCRIISMIDKIISSEKMGVGRDSREKSQKYNSKKFDYPVCLEEYIDQGLEFQRDGRLEEAIALYRKALIQMPDNSCLHNNLGVALRKQGCFSDAVAAYQKAIECDPGYADAYYNLGNAFQSTGEQEKAIRCYEMTIELCPHHAPAYQNLATVYLEMGLFERHMECFRNALRYIE